MAGVYNDPRTQASTVWHEGASAPIYGRGFVNFPAGRGWVQAVGEPRRGELAGMQMQGMWDHYHRIQYPDGSMGRTQKDFLTGLTGLGAGHAWGPPAPRLGGRQMVLGQTPAAAASGAGIGSPDTQLGTGAYATLSLIASTAGGAVIGYIASSSTGGAATGALFAGGMAALSDAMLFGREGNTGGAVMLGFAGALGMGGALYRFNESLPKKKKAV